MRVALDCDGVIYEWQRTCRYMLNLHRGYDLPPVEEWWHEWGSVKHAIEKEDWNWVWSQDAVDKGLWRHGHVTKGAIEGIDRLDKKHDIILITTRPRLAYRDTLAFVAFHNLPFKEVHILPDEPKSNVYFDVLVDDAPHNIEDALDKGRHAILFSRPWNTQFAADSDRPFFVARSWDDVVRAVESLPVGMRGGWV